MRLRSIHRAARGLLLALTLTSSPGAAPAAGEEGTVYVWTGVRGNIGRAPRIDVEVTSYGSDGLSVTRRVRPDEHVSRLRAELAELRLSDATDGPAPERESARMELWIRACDELPYEGQGEFLVELALERAESLAARGEPEAALAATHELLVPGRLAAQAGDFDLREADAAWLERAAAWLADPMLVALREDLASPQDDPTLSVDVDTVIEQHLARGNLGAVLQFGGRAVPVAERYVAEHPSDYPAMAEMDPLTMLFRLDEERGVRFALEHLEALGDLFALRVLRAMREAKVLENEGTWNFVQESKQGQSYTRAELIQPAWRSLLERLAARGELAADAFQEVGFLVEMDALSPGLASTLESAIRGEDPTRHQKALAALKDAGWRPTARPLLSRLLDHSLAQVRSFAAERLTTFNECREVWPLATDPSPDVRRAVLAGLRPGRERIGSTFGVGRFQANETGKTSLRGLDRGGLAVLETLLADSEPAIYLEAVDILVDNDSASLIPSMVSLRSLTHHSDARMRRFLPRVRVHGLPDAQILEALAQDVDADVLFAVDDALSDASAIGPNPPPDLPLKEGWHSLLMASSPWTDAYLPALVRRLATTDRIPEAMGEAPFVACHTPAGARDLANLALETQHRTLLLGLVQSLAVDVTWTGGVRGWHLVQPEVARDVLARAWGSAPDARAWGVVQEALESGPPGFQAAALEWSADSSLPWPLRLLGLRLPARQADEAWCDRLVALLSESTPLRTEPRSWVGELHELGRSVSGREVGSRLFAVLVEAEGPAEEALAFTLTGLGQVVSPAPQSARRLLQRWGDHGGSFVGLANLAMEHVQASEEEPELALFEQLLRVDGEIAGSTTHAMGRLHLRAHLPLLERVMAGELAATAVQRTHLQKTAVGALASYLDDEAAEILLRGVGMTTDAGVRDACFAALDTIRRYQDERARWNSRSDAGRARTEAIAELVGLIESGDAVQKVEAVRALGTLEALEELPRLVRLAGSRDAALAKAAKEALERIHAAGGGD